MFIIPLGSHCNISYTLQNLKIKKETSLFEWFQTDMLSSITKVICELNKNIIVNEINKTIYINNSDLFIIQDEKRISILNEKLGIFTYHYELNTYKNIFKRRIIRFFSNILFKNDLLFIRINHYKIPVLKEDLIEFEKCIKIINNKINIKFLLIDIIDDASDFKQIDLDFVTHKYFLKSDQNDEYLRDTTKDKLFYNIFVKWLVKIGYDMSNTFNIEFNDRSIV